MSTNREIRTDMAETHRRRIFAITLEVWSSRLSEFELENEESESRGLEEGVTVELEGIEIVLDLGVVDGETPATASGSSIGGTGSISHQR